jgi:glucose/arabinose dehydrogenase
VNVFALRISPVLAAALAISACTAAAPTPFPSQSAPASADPSAEFSLPPLPSGPDALDLEPFTSGFVDPVGLAFPPDGSGRLAVVEEGGTIRWVEADGTVSAVPALDIHERVKAGGEQGLLGLAFHPGFATNRRLFVNYTSAALGQTIVAEYAAAADGTTIDPASERILLKVSQPAANHNGGDLAFGPDGYLYIGLGDGGGANDQYRNGQNLDSLLAKMLRIDVDSPPASGLEYAIPPTNPFVNGGGRPEIWATGLRNPWQFSFDRDWGDLYIGDVGQDEWEEINRQPADDPGGANYGWPVFEGKHCFQAASCATAGFVAPIAEYSHELGEAVIGGYVYRGSRQPDLVGTYVFGDVGSGRLFTLQVDEGTEDPKVVRITGWEITAFGENEAGEIYVVALNGRLSRVVIAD